MTPKTGRIILLNNTLGVGGVEAIVRMIGKHAAASPYDVTIVLPETADLKDVGGLDVRMVSNNPLKAVIQIRRIVAEDERPTLLHAHHRRWSLLANAARHSFAGRRHVPLLEHVHNVFDDRGLFSFRGDVLITAGNGIADMLTETYGREAERVRVLLNPPGTERREIDLTDGPTSDVTVYGIGRVVPEKRPDEWSAVSRQLLNSGVASRAVWAGDGPLYEELSQASGSDIAWPGHVDNIFDILKPPGVLLVTSEREALPLAVIEALSAGIPVVARDIGSLRDAVETSVSGELLPPDASRSDFVAAVTRVLASDQYPAFSRGARDAYQRFTPTTFLTNLDQIYAESFDDGPTNRRVST